MDISPQYVAGFFDGEGYAGIYKWNGASESYTLRAQLTNTHREVLVRIQEVYGGNILAHDNGFHHNPKHANTYVLGWHGIHAKIFLQQIYPFLIVKRQRVELALQFPVRDRMQGYRTVEMVNAQRYIYEKMKTLNHTKIEIPEQYKNLALKEHEEHLRKKALAIQLSKEHPDWGYKRIGAAMGVSGTMVYKYLKADKVLVK